MTDQEAQQIATQELEKEEELLWTGFPDPNSPMRYVWGQFGFGAVWTCGIVSFTYNWNLHSPRDVHAPAGLFGMQGIISNLISLTLLVIGIYLMSTPVLVYLDALKTVYAITNRRIMIIRTGFKKRVQSHGPDVIQEMTYEEDAGGRGDLTFSKWTYRDADGDRQTAAIQFMGIPNVRAIEQLVRDNLLTGA